MSTFYRGHESIDQQKYHRAMGYEYTPFPLMYPNMTYPLEILVLYWNDSFLGTNVPIKSRVNGVYFWDRGEEYQPIRENINARIRWKKYVTTALVDGACLNSISFFLFCDMWVALGFNYMYNYIYWDLHVWLYLIPSH